MKKKKRIELQIDREKDKDVVSFLENKVDNQAGFIKHLLREYVIHMHPKQQSGTESHIVHPSSQNKTNDTINDAANDDMSFLSRNAYTSDDFK